jgi:hypothetical protein
VENLTGHRYYYSIAAAAATVAAQTSETEMEGS